MIGRYHSKIKKIKDGQVPCAWRGQRLDRNFYKWESSFTGECVPTAPATGVWNHFSLSLCKHIAKSITFSDVSKFL